MDPQATMQRILDAIKANDREECQDAAEDLAEWLRRGGFAPKFTAEDAGLDRYGELRRYLRLGERYAIMTRGYFDASEGWVFVEYTLPYGSERARWDLARRAAIGDEADDS